MDRATLRLEVERRLGDRRLVWFGTRGVDAESLTDVAQFDASFSLIATMRNRSSVQGLSLEDLTGERWDLDTFDIDDQLRTPEVAELRTVLLRALARRSALVTYRPTTFLSAIGFARQDRCRYLGMFKGHQSAFEHKPWLESSIAELGIAHVPWTYVADIDQLDTRRLLADGPVMLRRSRTTGGVGLVRLDDADRLEELWPDEDEAYVSVAPFIEGGVPVNVSAVVWRTGTTIHPASVQLIGVPGCTTRRFGYCGNDFGAVLALGDDVLEEIERATLVVAAWLRNLGYLGAFGVDFLVKDGVPLFMEVNPRFQGSTHASCQRSVEAGQSCLLLEHVAAFLEIEAPASERLADLADAPPLAHVVLHNLGESRTDVDPGPVVDRFRRQPGFCRADVLTQTRLMTRTGGTVARVTVRDRVTDDGWSLREPWRGALPA